MASISTPERFLFAYLVFLFFIAFIISQGFQGFQGSNVQDIAKNPALPKNNLNIPLFSAFVWLYNSIDFFFRLMGLSFGIGFMLVLSAPALITLIYIIAGLIRGGR